MPMPGPDTRVVEIRVAGLVGTSGETLLDAVATVDVAGDGLGRVIRPADRLPEARFRWWFRIGITLLALDMMRRGLAGYL